MFMHNKKNILVIGATSAIITPFLDYLENNDNYNLRVTIRTMDTFIGGLNVFSVCDLSKIEDILNLINKIKQDHFDYIYYNASITSDFITDYNVNFYAFYLICESLKQKINTKIILTSSISYLNITLTKPKLKDDILYNYRYTKKLALIYAYNSIQNDYISNIRLIHPGLSYTKLFKKLHPHLGFLKPFLNSPKKIFKTFKYSLEQDYNKKCILSPGLFKVKIKKINEKRITKNEYIIMKDYLRYVN